MADNRKLAQGLMMMTPAMREDLAGREQDIQRGKTVELLRRAGKEMYENPIVNTAIGFTPVLGDVQAAGETMAALNRGAPWQETAGYAAGMLPFMPMIGKTVWHGSPHSFEKFDLSKIGTGEGAQAYGHGLYLADAPEVAEGYRKTLSPNELIKSGEKIPYNQMSEIEAGLANDIASKKGNIDAVRSMYEGMIGSKFGGDIAEKRLNALNNMGADVGIERGGSLYKVDLPDEQIAKMLDWDKPLSEQPESVRNALSGIEKELPEISDFNLREWMSADPLASTWHNAIVRDLNVAPEELSQKLYKREIPGIQYFDSGSRGGGDGTRNYVVFSDEIPQILERNGQPIAQALREYRGSHTAPGPEFGAQLHDLTGGGQMYPDDVYSANAYRYYGHGGPDVALDKETTKIAQSFRNKPDEMVSIYRAVPNQEEITAINPGDWITINPNYAKHHGESALEGNYKILEQKVPAKTIWTNADSIHEYGYWPE